MIPIYFPHTYIPETVMGPVQTCFSPFAVCQPSSRDVPSIMLEWQQEGLIEMHAPPEGDEDRLSNLLTDFRNWAALHGGAHHTGFDYFRSRMGNVPFFDETSVTQIRADIKRGKPSNDAASGTRFFGARVFLSIAQEMDADVESLAVDLRRHDEFEKKLFSELTGDAGLAPPIKSPVVSGSNAQMDYMIHERLMAWWLLVSGITEQTKCHLPGIYVTTNRLALDRLIELATDGVKMMILEDIPVVGRNEGSFEAWRHEFLDQLLLLMQAEPGPNMTKGIDWPAAPKTDNVTTHSSVTIFLIPGKSPSAFFNNTICQADSIVDDQEPEARHKNTVLVLIET